MLDVEFIVSYLFNIFLLFCLAHLAIFPVQFRAHPLITMGKICGGEGKSKRARKKNGTKKNKEQGSVVRRPISANPGLNFNPCPFYVSSKAFSQTIFFILFRVANHQIADKKN